MPVSWKIFGPIWRQAVVDHMESSGMMARLEKAFSPEVMEARALLDDVGRRYDEQHRLEGK